MLGELGLEREAPPPRVFVISLVCLGVAVGATLLWPSATRQSGGIVWVLALVPVFLLSYHRGWRGAALAAALAMVALVLSEVALTGWLGRTVDWWWLAAGTVVVAATTLGAGAVSEGLHRQRKMAVLLAYRDPLTGLANRRLAREQARKLMATSDRLGTRVAVLSVKLGELDAINETHGHEVGDAALKEAAARLERHTRSGDTVARIGGNVLAVVAGDLESLDRCRDLAHRLRKALSVPFYVEEDPQELGAAVGAAVYPDHAGNFDRLLSDATTACRRAHRQAGVRVALHASTPPDAPADEHTFRKELERALGDGRVLPHYQPVVAVRAGAEPGLEALVRWEHSDLGLLAAREFVPVAERTGLVRRLDRRMLEWVVDELAALDSDADPCWISVNLAADTLQDAALADFVGDLLDEAGIPGRRLMLEVTEHTAIRNFHQVAATLDRLKEQGVRIAIDDFGTGHSSLAYLERIVADMVKLDMLFVQRLERGERSRRLLDGVIGLSHRLGIAAVAEGVESAEQLEALEDLGVDLAQGHHLGRPVPVGELG